MDVTFKFKCGDVVRHNYFDLEGQVNWVAVDYSGINRVDMEWIDKAGGFKSRWFNESDLTLATG